VHVSLYLSNAGSLKSRQPYEDSAGGRRVFGVESASSLQNIYYVSSELK